MITLAIFHSSRFVVDSFEFFCLKNNQQFSFFEIENHFRSELIITQGFDVAIISSDYFLDSQNEQFIQSLQRLKIKIVVLGRYSDEGSISYFLSKGVNCYLKEEEGFDMIHQALIIVNKSGLFSPYPLPHSLFNKRISPRFILTEKELRIFNCFRKEMTNQDVASLLEIHVKTVEFHRKNIIDKCESKNLIGAFDHLLSVGLIPIISK